MIQIDKAKSARPHLFFLFLFALLSLTPLYSLPPRYSKSPHTSQVIETKNGSYHFTYIFKDANEKTVKWEWSFPQPVADEMRKKFGISPNFFTKKVSFSYRTKEELKQKQEAHARETVKELSDGLYNLIRMNGKEIVKGDFEQIINFYLSFTTPIYYLIESYFEGKNPTPKERIELVLRFCQDIPYGIPPTIYNDKHIGGQFSPIDILVNGYGDCDSKVSLFGAILAHYPEFEFIAIYKKEHALMGIKGDPENNQKFFTFQGGKYIYAEPVGSARTHFGEENPGNGVPQIVSTIKIVKDIPSLHNPVWLKMVKSTMIE